MEDRFQHILVHKFMPFHCRADTGHFTFIVFCPGRWIWLAAFSLHTLRIVTSVTAAVSFRHYCKVLLQFNSWEWCLVWRLLLPGPFLPRRVFNEIYNRFTLGTELSASWECEIICSLMQGAHQYWSSNTLSGTKPELFIVSFVWNIGTSHDHIHS